MKVDIIPARPEHIIEICENLRERERRAFEQYSPNWRHFLMQEYAKSFITWAGLADGRIGAVWGAQTRGVLDDEAYIWMVGTPLIEQYPVSFLKHSRPAIAELRSMFKVVRGLVLADFECSVRWLKWLGFEVSPVDNGVCMFRSG